MTAAVLVSNFSMAPFGLLFRKGIVRVFDQSVARIVPRRHDLKEPSDGIVANADALF